MNFNYNSMLFNKEEREEFFELYELEINGMLDDGFIDMAVSHKENFIRLHQSLNVF